jgi:hypothetical protein
MLMKRVGVTIFAVALLLPAAATVSASAAEQPTNSRISQSEREGDGGEKKTCFREAKKDFQSTMKPAHAAKKAANHAARDTWLAATVEQRAEWEAAREAATTGDERKAAKAAFSASTVDEREAFKTAKREAHGVYKAAKSEARTAFRAAKKDCRNA